MKTRKLIRMRFGVFIYPGTEPIDLASLGVLSMARRIAPHIEIITIGPEAGEMEFASGLRVLADYGVANAPACDAIIVTGGPGWPEQAASEGVRAFFRTRKEAQTKIVSICTGAMILAASGVLDGLSATTKRRVVAPEQSPLRLLENHPEIDAAEASLVDCETVITGGGVSLCIDTTLYVIGKWLGDDVAQETAALIEYDRAWAANLRQFPIYTEQSLSA
jgi:transcriptional regulator GlxA family with amidase domain